MATLLSPLDLANKTTGLRVSCMEVLHLGLHDKYPIDHFIDILIADELRKHHLL
jgi:hypothetical protein